MSRSRLCSIIKANMDVNKYKIPNLPTTQHILEDLSNLNIGKNNGESKLLSDDPLLQNVYSCFHNFKTLESDLIKQSEINMELEELNRKLIENIDSMKTQTNSQNIK